MNDIISKRKQLDELEIKISKLQAKKKKLLAEIKLLEQEEKIKQYEILEVSLKDSGMTLEELIKSIK